MFKKKPARPESTYGFMPLGFHGDRYLLDVVSTLLGRADIFIETGTNVGSTLAYVAKTFPNLPCYSCEPDVEAYRRAIENTKDISNVHLYNQLSQDFIKRIETKHSDFLTRQALFWLDAHGYGFQWPLKDEISFITRSFPSAYILIDDFQVPGVDIFGYDQYQDQICSYEGIKDAIKPGLKFNLYYPAYTEHTSPHHPLRGWGLIEYGHSDVLAIEAKTARVETHSI
jgi:hypothetical protein